ncbi:MAG TPA: hydrogenase maturation nickel metallochaperone HypA [bacterium]|nr:hydrogenase maturation nickel metallochaperone HypA [bacterium]
MHESYLIAGLMKKLETVARDERAKKISGIKVKLGALSHMSKDHFREHFEHASKNTVAEGASLEIQEMTDIHDANAQEIILESIELEEADA